MGMQGTEGRALAAELIKLFGRGVDQELDDADFNALALRVFEYQMRHNAPYAAYARLRRRGVGEVRHWGEIPAVPTAAFKEVALVSGVAADAEAIFRTSGTTRGEERRGEHYILDLTLYHASLLPNFAAYLLPDGITLPMLSLMPPAYEMPDSSLAHMLTVVSERLGAEGSRSYATVAEGIDEPGLEVALRRHEGEGRPVCLLGTSFAFVHWTDSLRARGVSFQLPPGSRLMDTGGFKGRSREVAADELRATYLELLGIPADYLVNEYGMAEMCSQFYDSILRDRVRSGRARSDRDRDDRDPGRQISSDEISSDEISSDEISSDEISSGRAATDPSALAGPRLKVAPPWVRTEVVSPEILEPLPPGEVGILRHYDLANLGSVIGVQTEDLGRKVPGGFELLGRAAGAPPRGCSIATDLLLEAVAGRTR